MPDETRMPDEPMDRDDYADADEIWDDPDAFESDADIGLKGGSTEGGTGIWDPTTASWQSILEDSDELSKDQDDYLSEDDLADRWPSES